jgi:hypothetical protein
MRTIFAAAAVLLFFVGTTARGGDDLSELKKKRLEAAKRTYEITFNRYRNAERADVEPLVKWSRHWLDSQLDMCETAREKVAAYQAHFERMKEFERLVAAEVKAGVGTVPPSAAAFHRLEAEIWLVQAKGKK